MISHGITLPSGERFFGYKKDTRRFQRSALALVGKYKTAPVPASGDLSAFRAPMMDQGRDGACTGYGTSQGLFTACGAAGSPLSFVPSQQGIYWVRALERANDTTPLTDSGAMPADLITMVGRYGILPMRVAETPDGRFGDIWGPDDGPATPNVNDEPDFDALETAGQTLITGEYRIDETSSMAYDQAASCISQVKAPVGVGLFVDTGFMNWTSSLPPIDSIDTGDPSGGGHWVSVDSYETMIVGGLTQRVFSICNSWGTEAGDGGVYRITERALRMAVSDLIPWTVRNALSIPRAA
jgi:hypothetical protein